jgi:hypothetical protein
MFFDEVVGAPTTEELTVGLYEKALPAVREGMERHLRETNPLADHPSVRLCKFALMEIGEMIEFGRQAIEKLVDPTKRQAMAGWVALLDDLLAAAGGLDGTRQAVIKPVSRQYSAKPYVYDPVPKRDERFTDPYNMGVNAEVFLYDEQMPPRAKTLMIFYKRLREIDVPEMMAGILAQTPGKPWKYYRDMTRQLWDESRHAMMGEVGFVNLGIDWAKYVRVNFTWSLGLNTQLEPWERHAVLYFIEQGLMPKTGKRYEWEVGVASANPLAALFQDYDWADEVLHSKIGRDLYVSQFKSSQEAISYGDKCWSKVLMGWREWKEQGLTGHENWWPALYREACRRWGIEPDPKVEAFGETYEKTRADLKEVSVSG